MDGTEPEECEQADCECESSSGEGSPGPARGPERRVLFERLMHESRANAPGAPYSRQLRQQIERLSPMARRSLATGTRGGAAPLFVACARGNLQAAQYLIQVCGAPLEQRGEYRAPADPAPHRVTPLWAAAVAGRLDVLALLAAAGADPDARSDTGSTPLRSACFVSHVEVARFLLARGADPNAANHTGGTPLVNSVQSERLCALLLDAGAAVDAPDAQLKTPLHYAVQEHRLDTARLLLDRGADPRRETRDGDDALRLACIKGAGDVVQLLLSRVQWARARVADAYELLGATRIDEYNDVLAALPDWHRATALRHGHNTYVAKRPVRAPLGALRGAREWTRADELRAHAGDADWLRTQALLVAMRVLGTEHRDTLFRIMYRGAAYADALRYERSVELWTLALNLRIRKDTLLDSESCQTLLALTRLLLEARGAEHRPAEPRAAIELLRYINRAVPECQALLAVRPACRAQAGAWGRALRCAAHLILVALGPTDDPDPDPALLHEVRALVRREPRAPATGDSLLHLACSRLNVIRSTYFADELPQESVFPCPRVVRVLAACGADVAARNRARCTPLHVAAIPHNFSTELVEALVAAGAHLDQPNRFGDSPAELVVQNPQSRVCPLRHVTLACRAARALVSRGTPDLAALPATLRPFLDLHRPCPAPARGYQGRTSDINHNTGGYQPC